MCSDPYISHLATTEKLYCYTFLCLNLSTYICSDYYISHLATAEKLYYCVFLCLAMAMFVLSNKFDQLAVSNKGILI